MKKLLTIALNRILILFGCFLAVMACSNDDNGDGTAAGTDETGEVVKVDSLPEKESVDSLPEEGSTDSLPKQEAVDSLPNIVELIKSAELSLFESALAKTDLADTLSEEGPFTVFAPTDDAVRELFVLLGDEYNSFDDFKNPIEQQILNEILLGHVVEGKIASENFEAGILSTLLPEDSIELIAEEDTFVIKDASEIHTNFVSFDLAASNGTVHTIDKILIPQKLLAFVE